MHFYWRIIEELKCLGETWVFNDPSLRRSYTIWIHRNADAVRLFNELESPGGVHRSYTYGNIPHSLN